MKQEQAELVNPMGKYTFKLGDSFSSYKELEERLEAHSKESFVTYWRRDTRTVQGAQRKTSRPISSDLIYYSLRLACVFGGQKFSTRGQGKRSCQTLRSDCPAYITLRASKCGQKLEVISLCNTHNHELSEKLNKSLAKNRKLSPEMKEEVLLLLATNVTRSFIIEYIKIKTGKELTKKDLFNMAATSRRKEQKVESQAKVAETLQNMKNFLLNHSAMYQKFQDNCEPAQVQKFDDSDTFLDDTVIISSPDTTDIDVETSEASSVLGIIPDNSQPGQYIEFTMAEAFPEDADIIQYLSQGPIEKQEIKEKPPQRRRKRWKNSCYCRCRGASVKLLEMRMKFLRLKCRKMQLELQELRKKKNFFQEIQYSSFQL